MSKPYIENPKTRGSGIICAIPQQGRCPMGCDDCFYQSGRSYLEPLDEHTPNLPAMEDCRGRVVRINDGNDSNNQRGVVMDYARELEAAGLDFYLNTSIPDPFNYPWILTLNPGKRTDQDFCKLDEDDTEGKDTRYLMLARFRTNAWNLDLCDKAVAHYTSHGIPVVLTFMRYTSWTSVNKHHVTKYMERKATMNTYIAIRSDAWREIMRRYEDNNLVYSCGIEGEKGTSACKRCGNCLREYYRVKEATR